MDARRLSNAHDQPLPVTLVLQVYLGRKHLEGRCGSGIEGGMTLNQEHTRAQNKRSEEGIRSHGNQNGRVIVERRFWPRCPCPRAGRRLVRMWTSSARRVR